MERILKSLLDHLLRDYVTFSKETGDGAFKASFSSTGILLHDIEFNLDKLKIWFPDVRRAWAGTLEIKVPWSMLGTTSKSLEVHVSSIRLVLTKDPQEVKASNEEDKPGSLHSDESSRPDGVKESSKFLHQTGVRSGVYSGIFGYLLEMSVFIADIQISYEFDQDNIASFSIDWVEVTSNGIDTFNDVVVKCPSDWIDKEVLMNGIKFALAIQTVPTFEMKLTHANLNMFLPKSLLLRSQKNDGHLVVPMAITLGDIWCDVNVFQVWPIMQLMLSRKGEVPYSDSNIWSKLMHILSVCVFSDDCSKGLGSIHTFERGTSQANDPSLPDSSWELEIGVTLSSLCFRARTSNLFSFQYFSFEASLIASNLEVDHCGRCDASLWVEEVSLGHVSSNHPESEFREGNIAPFLNISPARIDNQEKDLKKIHGLMLHLVRSTKEVGFEIDCTLGRICCINTLPSIENFADSVKSFIDECSKKTLKTSNHSGEDESIRRPYKIVCRLQELLVGINCEEYQVSIWVQGSRIEAGIYLGNHSNRYNVCCSGEIDFFLEERDFITEQSNPLKLSSTAEFYLDGSNESFVLNAGPFEVKLNHMEMAKILSLLLRSDGRQLCLALGELEYFEFNLDSLETGGSRLLIYNQGAFTLGISTVVLLHLETYSCRMSAESTLIWVPANVFHVSVWMLNVLVAKTGDEFKVLGSDMIQASCSTFSMKYLLGEEVDAMSIAIGSIVLQAQLSSLPKFMEAVAVATSPFRSQIAQRKSSTRLQQGKVSSQSSLDEFSMDFVSICFVEVCPNAERMLHIWVTCVQGSNHQSTSSSDFFIVEVQNLGIDSEVKGYDQVHHTSNLLTLVSEAYRGVIVIRSIIDAIDDDMITKTVSIVPASLHLNSNWSELLVQTLVDIKDAQSFLSALLENGPAFQSTLLRIEFEAITIELSDPRKGNVIVCKSHHVTCGISTQGICYGRPWLDDSVAEMMEMKVLLKSSSCNFYLRNAATGQIEKIISTSPWSLSLLKWPLGDFKSIELGCPGIYIHGSIATWTLVYNVMMTQKIQLHSTPCKQPGSSNVISNVDDIRGHPTVKDCSCSFECFMAIRLTQQNSSEQQTIWWSYHSPRLINSIRLQFPLGMDVPAGANISLYCCCDRMTVTSKGKLGSNGELILSKRMTTCSHNWGIEWNLGEIPFRADELLNMLFVKSDFEQIPRVACRSSGRYAESASHTCFKIIIKHISIDLVAMGWPECPHPCIRNHSLMNVLLGVTANDLVVSGEDSRALKLSISCSLDGYIMHPITFSPHKFISGELLRIQYMQWEDKNNVETESYAHFENLTSNLTSSLSYAEGLDKYRASEQATFHQITVHCRENILITFPDSFLLVGQQWISMLMSDSCNQHPLKVKNMCRVRLFMREKDGNNTVTVVDPEEEMGILLEQSKSLAFRPESSLEWSHPVEVLSCHVEMLEIGYHRLAAEVRLSEGSFLLKICSGIAIVNRTYNPLHLLISSHENRHKVILDPGSEHGIDHVDISLSIETESGWTQTIHLREQVLSPRRDGIKKFKEHGSDFLLILGVQNCSESGRILANIYPPVSLSNRLSQCILLKDSRGQRSKLRPSSSVDLRLPSCGGEVVKVGIYGENKHEELVIGIVCPPYGVADEFHLQIEEKDCVYVPPPGQSVGIRIPWATNPDVKVLLVSQLREYGTLSLELRPRVTPYNRTNLFLQFKVDQGDYNLSPSSELGVSDKANILSCCCGITDHKFPFTWKGCDASFSQENVIDFVSYDQLKSLRLYLQIERSPSGVSIEIRPFYYISNDTDYIFHDGYNSYQGDKPIPFLGVTDIETLRIRLARTKRRPNGGFLTIDYVMLDSGGIFTPKHAGIGGDFTCSSVVKPSHVHFIFRRTDRTFEIINKTDDNLTLSFADSAANLLRSIYLPKAQCHSIQMHGTEYTIQISVEDASTSFPISELMQGCVFQVQSKYMLHMMSRNTCAIVSVGLLDSKIERFLLELPTIVIECSSNRGYGTNTLQTSIGSTTVRGNISSFSDNFAINLRMTDWQTSILSISESTLFGKSKGRDFIEISAEMFIEKHTLVAQWMKVVLSETHFNLDDTVVCHLIDFLRNFPRGEILQPVSKDQLIQEFLELEESKFLVENFSMDKVRATCDIHLSDSVSLPLSIDANRAPISLSAISCERETNWREIIRIFETNAYDGLVVSIPSAIGSLQLLFDPLGLVRSLRRGLFDMVQLPLLGIQEKSLSHFITGLHRGSASLFKEISGWSISSIKGFSTALVRIVSISHKSSQHSTIGDCDREGAEHGRKILCGSHLFPKSILQFCSSNEILFYRDLVEAKVSIRREMDFAFRIEDPVVILLKGYVAVLANSGRIASFLITVDNTHWELDPSTRRLCMKTNSCYSFADLSCPKIAYVELLFDNSNFDLFRLIFEDQVENQ